jgi:elongation factor 1-alpha
MGTFFIQNIYRITGIGSIPVGKVERGILKVGMKSEINGTMIQIKSIEKNHQQLSEAKEGDNIGINVQFISPPDMNASFFKRIFGKRDDGYDLLKTFVNRSIEFI